MELITAKSILKEAQSGGFLLADEFPEEDEAIFELAEYFVGEAQAAKGQGMKHDSVMTIIKLAESDKVLKTYRRRSSVGFSESDERETEKWIENEGDKEKVEKTKEFFNKEFDSFSFGETKVDLSMPNDITELSDKEVRRLHGLYASLLADVKWKLANEMVDLNNASHLRDDEYRRAALLIRHESSVHGDRVSKDEVDTEANQKSSVKEWAEKVRDHQNRVTELKALSEIYSGNISVLSREMTMRADEWERTR